MIVAISPDQFDRLAARIPNIGRDPAAVRVRIEAYHARAVTG